VDKRMESLAKKTGQASKPQAAEPAKPQAKAEPQAKPAAKPKPVKKKLTYTVRRGDTLFTVAQRYKVRMSDLMKWNNIKKGDVLKIGEKLSIYR
jgi:membrane-bound lytic murein transglycosylase D